MLNYITTSLFDSPAQTLVNTVNTVGVMGKGVAAEFKRRYPEMFMRYRQFCQSGAIDIGKLYLYRTPDKWVLNFPTKKLWRQPSKIEYVKAGLEKFICTYTEQGITSISFPELGCGNGGLNWSREVRPMMEHYLKGLPIPVYVHLTPRPANFVPEHLDFKALASYRQDVGFEQFWNELRAVANVMPTQRMGEDWEPLVLEEDGEALSLPAQDFQDLWNSLRLRGALPIDQFPGVLREHKAIVVSLLRKLNYIQPFQFASATSSGRLSRQEGIRFAPPPEVESALPIPVERSS
jgi:O-acetyl-ADP-ribose deacetylase (regulator of RNase III)